MDMMGIHDVHEEGAVAWKVAEAKQRLSELLRDAAREPQEIYNRERLVGVVVGAEEFAEYRSWRARSRRSLAEACEEARRICADEGPLPVPGRRNRRSVFPGPGRTGSR